MKRTTSLPDQRYHGEWFDTLKPLSIDVSDPNFALIFDDETHRQIIKNIVTLLQTAGQWVNFSWHTYAEYCRKYDQPFDESHKQGLLELETNGLVNSGPNNRGWLGVTSHFLYSLQSCIKQEKIQKIHVA